MRSDTKRIRILHVEDDDVEARLTQLILKRLGYNNFDITWVPTAERGLEILCAGNFDIIIADYKMPRMNGIEFLEAVRREGNDIPFIIFTGKGEERVAMDALNKGANRYITKDGAPAVIFDTLGRYIQEVVEEKEKAEAIARRLKQLEEMVPRLREASETLSVERRAKKTYIDTYSFINEYMDLIILGLLVEKPMTVSDIIEEIKRKFGVLVPIESLSEPVDELEERGIIERRFSKEQESFVFKLGEDIEGLFRGSTFSSEMLTRFLKLV